MVRSAQLAHASFTHDSALSLQGSRCDSCRRELYASPTPHQPAAFTVKHFNTFVFPSPSPEILSGGHAEGHGDALQHGDGGAQHHPPGAGGRAHAAAQQHPAADAGVPEPAQPQDEAGGGDRHVQAAAGRGRRLHVRPRMKSRPTRARQKAFRSVWRADRLCSRYFCLSRLQDALEKQKTVTTKVMTVTQTVVDGKVVSSSTETKNL